MSLFAPENFPVGSREKPYPVVLIGPKEAGKTSFTNAVLGRNVSSLGDLGGIEQSLTRAYPAMTFSTESTQNPGATNSISFAITDIPGIDEESELPWTGLVIVMVDISEPEAKWVAEVEFHLQRVVDAAPKMGLTPTVLLVGNKIDKLRKFDPNRTLKEHPLIQRLLPSGDLKLINAYHEMSVTNALQPGLNVEEKRKMLYRPFEILAKLVTADTHRRINTSDPT